MQKIGRMIKNDQGEHSVILSDSAESPGIIVIREDSRYRLSFFAFLIAGREMDCVDCLDILRRISALWLFREVRLSTSAYPVGVPQTV